MNLIIDFGNTQLKVAVFEFRDLKYFQFISYNELNQLIAIFDRYDFSKLGITSVREIPPDFKKVIDKYTCEKYFLKSGDPLPISLNYTTPQTLGNDRICNVIGAKSIFPDKNVLVIDLGTCNKYDFITKNGVYLGGAISPGFKMRFDSMNYYTDQLPEIQPEAASEFIGDSTKNSMISGAFYGVIGEINFFIEQYIDEFSDIEIVLTGGFLTYFEKDLKNHIFADPYLTLKGLNEILNFQVNK